MEGLRGWYCGLRGLQNLRGGLRGLRAVVGATCLSGPPVTALRERAPGVPSPELLSGLL